MKRIFVLCAIGFLSTACTQEEIPMPPMTAAPNADIVVAPDNMSSNADQMIISPNGRLIKR